MDSIHGPDAVGWRCTRCGHAVPIDNREVHEARCGRDPSPTATPRLLPVPPPTLLTPFDPDEEPPSPRNVFTPGSPARSAQIPPQPTPPPQQQQPAAVAAAAAEPSRPWREVNLPAAVAAAAARERREGQAQTARRRLQAMQERTQRGERPFSSSSSSSSESGYVFVEAAAGAGERAGAGAGAGAAAGARADGDGGGRESETTWACNACTFLNGFDVSSCGMCGTRMSPQQRPPDRTYRETLIDNGAPTGSGGGRRRRQAGAAGDFEAAAEEARCRLLAEQQAAGRSGGRGDGGDGLIDTGGAVSGAAAGSVLGAISAGMLSAIQPGARPGRVLASALQGALMGGAAGAALGGVAEDTGDPRRGGGDGGGDRTEGDRTTEGDGDGDDLGGWQSQRRRQLQRQRQRQRQLSFEVVGHPRTRILLGGGGAGGTELDLGIEESLLLARRMEELNLPDAAAEMRRQGMRDMVEGPRGILRRRRQPHLHEQEEDGDGGTRPASARAIAALPEETLTAGSLSHLKEDGRQCCICLEDFGAGDEVKRLQCLHLYHTVCIQNWLQTSGTCPQCKHRVD